MKITVKQITFTAMLMAITVVLCSFHVPLAFAHLYLVDIAVCTAGILLNPFLAIIAGSVGAFIGDLMFYPAAMIVTLAVRTVQVVIISVFSHYIMKNKPFISSLIGCAIGATVMIAGYCFLGAAVYGNQSTLTATIELALAKLPEETLQAAVGVAVALPLCYKFRLREIYENAVKNGGV